ncbi:MAG TPA: hypothetical protein VMJ10_06700 [Kofleriaceae bacterium]|nr:hypothetical protein [Kofleriaceae bacterium]
MNDHPVTHLGRRETIALRVSAVLTLVGLAMMVWSILVPTPLPVMLAMSVGQFLGTTAFAIYLFIVVRQLRREWRRARPDEEPEKP